MDKPSYINKRGKTVVLEISKHAMHRFNKRWRLLHPDVDTTNINFEEKFVEIFRKAARVELKKKKDIERAKRYGEGSVYFSCHPFSFVIADATIVTVEINDEELRFLNKVRKRNEILYGLPSESVIKPVKTGSTQAPCYKQPSEKSTMSIVGITRTAAGTVKVFNLGHWLLSDKDKLVNNKDFIAEISKRLDKKLGHGHPFHLAQIRGKTKGEDFKITDV